MAIITPAQVRDLYPALVGSGEDTRLSTVIGHADALCAAYCGYPRPDSGPYTLAAATYTLYLARDDSADARILRVPVRPIVSVTGVNVDDTWAYGTGTAYSTSTDVTYDARDGLLLASPTGVLGGWSDGPRGNKIVLVAGYSTAPDGLVAILALAVRELLDRGRTGDQTAGTSSRQSYTRPQATHILSDAVRASLDHGYAIVASRGR